MSSRREAFPPEHYLSSNGAGTQIRPRYRCAQVFNNQPAPEVSCASDRLAHFSRRHWHTHTHTKTTEAKGQRKWLFRPRWLLAINLAQVQSSSTFSTAAATLSACKRCNLPDFGTSNRPKAQLLSSAAFAKTNPLRPSAESFARMRSERVQTHEKPAPA